MKDKFLAIIVIFVLVIGYIVNTVNTTIASEISDEEPPYKVELSSIPKLVNWMKTSQDATLEDFLEDARAEENLLVVMNNNGFSLTQLYVDEENAMNYVFERNRLRYTIRVFLPENPLYADMESFISEKNQLLETKYEDAQYSMEIAVINQEEIPVYSIDGKTYTGKNGNENRKQLASAYFKLEGYPVQVVIMLTGFGDNTYSWNSSDLEDFHFAFVSGAESLQASGDINRNGVIEAEDALKVLKACVKLEVFTTEEMICADVNGDCAVDTEDALSILKRTVKLIDKFDVEKI